MISFSKLTDKCVTGVWSGNEIIVDDVLIMVGSGMTTHQTVASPIVNHVITKINIYAYSSFTAGESGISACMVR